MKTGIVRKLCAAAVSLMLCGSAVPSVRAGMPDCGNAVSVEAYDDAPVVMCVTLEGGALPGLAEKDLTAPGQVRSVQQREQMQDAVFEAICALYPEAEFRYRYSLLMNGFSCVMPESLADAVREIPGVTDVSRCGEMQVTPCMAEAAALGGIPDFYQETGCTGEGQVICVIDTELDVTHPMFAPLSDDVNVKLTKDYVQEIAQTVGFHVDADPEKLYISSKVPFAADYDSDDPYSVSNPIPSYYHGTHVAGIAAGNAVQDDDGKMISGIARDAQLVFMAIDEYLVDYVPVNETEDPALEILTVLSDLTVAMLEDAVKLRADVVNMSFGTDFVMDEDDHLFTRVVNAAAESGVTVCIAAGNDGDLTLSESPELADRDGMNGLISEGSKALAVASANNKAMLKYGVIRQRDRQIPCAGYITDEYQTELYYLNAKLPEGYYDYVYCGNGDESDFEGVDLKGKIALTERGNYFMDMQIRAEAAGAAGLIVRSYDNDLNFRTIGNEILPFTLISADDGEYLKNASGQQIYISEEYADIEAQTKVSSYTSWGMLPSLELRPDIMGIGGNVRSAAYDGAFESLSGTSMATPYLAGCTALLNEYLERCGCELTGEAKQQRIRNLLMTGAVPYETDGVYDSPRQQGAGLVSLDKSIGTKVILTGPEGESKLSLHDRLGDAFSFPVTVTNFGNEDVQFSNARLVLCTDRADTDSEPARLSGMQSLNCQADCSALQEIAAGESRTVNISVRLDSAETAALSTVFKNGIYIDGYLLLEGAENNPDISIPLSGFSGDYCDITIVDHICGCVTCGLNSMLGGYSMLDFAETAKEIMEPLLTDQQRDYLDLRYNKNRDPEAWENLAGIENNELAYEISDIQDLVRDSIEKRAYEYDGRMLYVSPDSDLIADQPAIGYYSPYQINIKGMTIRDAAGKTVSIPQYRRCLQGEYDIYSLTCADVLTDLAEGAYTAGMTFTRASDGSSGRVSEEYSVPFTVDRTPPEVTSEISEQNGRKILTLTAEDPILDGFMILGTGNGGAAGSYDPANKPEYPMLPLHYFLTGTRHATIDLLVTVKDAGGDNVEYGLTNSMPLNRLLWNDETAWSWLEQFNFSDFVRAEPDANGVSTLSYDITDFTAYDISVIDRACNITEVSENVTDPGRPDPKENPLKPGIYRSAEMVIEVTEDTIRVVPFCNKQLAETYSYTYEYQFRYKDYYYGADGYYLHFTAPDGREETFRLSEYEGGDIGMTGDYSFFFRCNFDPHKQTFTRADQTTADDFILFGYDEALGAFVSPYMMGFTGGRMPDKIEVSACFENADHVVAHYTYTYGSPSIDFSQFHVYSVTVDLTSGTAELPDGTVQKIELAPPVPGDIDLNGTTDVADAVLLARFLVEDEEAEIRTQGLRNADCNKSGAPDHGDLVMILRAIARLITLEG